MLTKTGIPTSDDISQITPTVERMTKGAVAVIECYQEIPCDPCMKACKFGAITMGQDINALPQIDENNCNGCGVCISYCPGLAIFVVDRTYSEQQALVKLPFEYVPRPEVGEYVTGLNRAGEEIGQFEVIRVTSGGEKNKTYTISLAVPQELAMEVRGLSVNAKS